MARNKKTALPNLRVPHPEVIGRRLVQAGPQLPPQVEEDILTLGQAAIQPLSDIALDKRMAAEDGPGSGYPAIHAVELLGKLKATSAIPSLLELLVELDTNEILYSTTIYALGRMGPALVEPALSAYATRPADSHFETAVAEALANCGARDPRLLNLFVEILERPFREQLDPDDARFFWTMGAAYLAIYGDPTALPALYRALDAIPEDEDLGFFDNQHISEIEATIEELGGSLTFGQAQKLQRNREQREQHRRRLLSEVGLQEDASPEDLARRLSGGSGRPIGYIAERRPGRKDPCWCGSSKKYKKCHWLEDEKTRSSESNGPAIS